MTQFKFDSEFKQIAVHFLAAYHCYRTMKGEEKRDARNKAGDELYIALMDLGIQEFLYVLVTRAEELAEEYEYVNDFEAAFYAACILAANGINPKN